MKEQGCSWTGELGGLNRHLNDCQYVTISCTKGCGTTLQRHCMAVHIAESCPKRDFTCEYCGFKSTYEVCNKHWSECVKYSLPCPNKCGIAKVQRGSLEQHLNECPLQQVECEFCHAGCKDKIQRKDLKVHMENVQKHLSLLSAFAVKKLAQKDEEIRHLQSRVQNLENVALVSPVEFTMYGYSQYEEKGKQWEDGPTLYTCSMGYKVKIAMYFWCIFKQVDVKLQSVDSKFDDHLQWPLKCTLSLQLLAQLGEHHLERRAELQIKRGSSSNAFGIKYDEIRNPTNGAQHLKEDCLHFRVDVKHKTPMVT